MPRSPLVCLMALLVVGSSICSIAADWPAFRGADGSGVSVESSAPLHWSSEENIVWKAPLPSLANSSPIVSEGKVFITAGTADGKRRGLYCFDRANGRELWVREVDYPDIEPTHRTNPYCGATAVADGARVIVWHSSAGMYAYDHDGNELWHRDLGKFNHVWGYGSSPIIHGEKVILNGGPGLRSFVIALDRRTGETLWRHDEDGGSDDENRAEPKGRAGAIGSWSTPLVVQVDGKDQLLVSMPGRVLAFDPENGQVLWSVAGLGKLVYTSVVAGEGRAVAMSGYSGPAIAFKLGGEGDVTETNLLWSHTKPNPQRIGSGIIVGDHLFMVNEPGTAQCLDMRTGEELWQARLPGGKAWGAMVMAAGRFYVTNQAGTTVVFAPSTTGFELLAENELGEASNSTPAVSNGQMFVRTADHLWCVAGPIAP